MAGNTGETDKNDYSASNVTKKQQHMSKEKVQGKVTFNIKAFREYNHQRPFSWLSRTIKGLPVGGRYIQISYRKVMFMY